jgi:hypothetical protein
VAISECYLLNTRISGKGKEKDKTVPVTGREGA